MTLTKLMPVMALLVLALAGCAALVDNRATTREARINADYPPTGRILDVDGQRVHVQIAGSGPDVVLLHGASGNLRDFTFDLMGRLAGDYRVIAFDRPGLGWTDSLGATNDSPLAQAALLRAAADQIGVRNPVLVGHSYGGAVAMAWALADPDGPAAIVQLAGATHPWPGELEGWYPFITSRFGRSTAVPAITAFAPLGRADEVIERIFAPQSAPPGYADHVGAGLSLRRDSLSANARQVMALKPYLEQMAPLYPRLRQPIEIVHGDADTTVGLEFHARRMEAEVPGARLTVLPGVGHMPHHAAPDQVVAAIHRAAARAGLR
ncbi:MAG: alpha/beta fold hydrolase [Paracoccus sp. (in: a-proteobacteria)]|uniref:alpha/beta fold hydrolase n=1 Tax=Paracoccus sp. TaxID=267 RepID=UPI00391C3CA4